MYMARRFTVRHARGFEALYQVFEPLIAALDPLWRRIGYQRVERPVVAIERAVKGFLFDCQMCGRCTLSATGMSCPMNCPKNLRNGPCGGVRMNGNCEVKPDMRCVWVEAFERSLRMPTYGHDLIKIQPPVNRQLEGSSSWINMLHGIDKETPHGWIKPAEISIINPGDVRKEETAWRLS